MKAISFVMGPGVKVLLSLLYLGTVSHSLVHAFGFPGKKGVKRPTYAFTDECIQCCYVTGLVFGMSIREVT